MHWYQLAFLCALFKHHSHTWSHQSWSDLWYLITIPITIWGEQSVLSNGNLQTGYMFYRVFWVEGANWYYDQFLCVNSPIYTLFRIVWINIPYENSWLLSLPDCLFGIVDDRMRYLDITAIKVILKEFLSDIISWLNHLLKFCSITLNKNILNTGVQYFYK